MSAPRCLAASSFFTLAVTLVACGSAPIDEEVTSGGVSIAGTLGSSSGAIPADAPACVKLQTAATNVPVFLSFVFDKSLSMNFGKYEACAKGLKTFFADANTSGVQASLQFFPLSTLDCNVGHYKKPRVTMRNLPDTKTFSDAFDADGPNTLGTPMLPALRASIDYVKSFKGQAPGAVAAVVLVTDGEPFGCLDGGTPAVAAAAKEAAADVKTFVVGLGSKNALDKIAAAGGTGQATIVKSKDPAQIGPELAKTMADIKGQFGCSFKLPDGSSDQKLDLATVNIVAEGSSDALDYDKDCTGSGWRYDDPTAPTRIDVCPKACADFAAQSKKLSLQVGCTTKGTDGRIPK